MQTVHATCVALKDDGVLLCGESGSGKSDLALRLLDDGAVLVADDRVVLAAEQGALWASAPATLRRLLEVRGVGIVRLPVRERVRLRLAVELVDPAAVPRLPEPEATMLCGLELPLLRLAGHEASAVAKIRLKVRALHADLLTS